MTSKERVLTTFEFREPDRVPCWLGASPEFIDNAIKELGLNNEEELLHVLGDDFRRVIAPYLPEDPGNDTPVEPNNDTAGGNWIRHGHRSSIKGFRSGRDCRLPLAGSGEC